MKNCSNCKGPILEYEHPLNVCSFKCLKLFQEMHNIKMPPLPSKLIDDKGNCKNHFIWVQKKNQKE